MDISKIKVGNTTYDVKDTAARTVMGASGTNHSAGLVPDPGATAGTSKFLREDGTWQTPSGGGASVSVMVGSGENHASGLVPDPGATAGTTKFLREDGTWNVPATPTLSTMIDQQAQTYQSSIDSNGHDYVEIGGVKWATMNVGANSITDTGLYFQWGDTQGYTSSQVGSGEGQKYFGWEDYKYGNGTSSPGAAGITKYNQTDGKTVLEPSDDAVTAAWGGDWRMPTADEFNMLYNATTVSYESDYQNSGIAGFLFTDKIDSSKTLFFPCTERAYSGQVTTGNNNMYLHSSDIRGLNCQYYIHVSIPTTLSRFAISCCMRYIGLPVRGVLGKSEINTNSFLCENYQWESANDDRNVGQIYKLNNTQNYICIMPGNCYLVTNSVTQLFISLPAVAGDSNKTKSAIISFTTGSSPNINISSAESISYFSDYAIEANKTYELNCMWNGAKWIVAYGTIS